MAVPAVEEPDRDDEWNIDHIWARIGQFGAFQKRAFIVCVMSDVVVAMSILFFIFADYNHGWKCDWQQIGLPPDVDNTTLTTVSPFQSTVLGTFQDPAATEATIARRKKRSVWSILTNQEPEIKSREKRRSIWSDVTAKDPITTDNITITTDNITTTNDNITEVPTTQLTHTSTQEPVTEAATTVPNDTTTEQPTTTPPPPKDYFINPEKVSGTCFRNDSNITKCPGYLFTSADKTTTTEWGLICDLDYVPILCITLLFFGMLVGSFIADIVAEMIGRKKTLMLLTFGTALFQVLTGVCQIWELYAFFRFLVGFFTGGLLRYSRLLPLEFTGAQWKNFVRFFSVFEIGYLLLLACAYLLQDWRHLAFLTGGLMFPVVLLIFFLVPESGRWLLHQERYSEIKDLIRMVADVNGKEITSSEIKQFVKGEKKMKAITESAYKYTYKDLFSTKKFALRTCTVMLAWFTHSLMYHMSFVMIFMEPGDHFVNVLSAATSTFLALASCYPITGRFGRKRAYGIFILVPVSALTVEVLFYGLGLRLRDVTIGVVILTGAYSRALDLLVGKYTNEIFPGQLRHNAIGLGCIASKVAAVVSPIAAYSGVLGSWANPFIICFVFAVVSAVLIMISWPETGKSMVADLPPAPTTKAELVGKSSFLSQENAGHHFELDEVEERHQMNNGKSTNEKDTIALDLDDSYMKTKDA